MGNADVNFRKLNFSHYHFITDYMGKYLLTIVKSETHFVSEMIIIIITILSLSQFRLNAI